MEVIAEVKTRSPFDRALQGDWDRLFELAASIGDVLSIHTDRRWGGAFEHISRARERTRVM